MDITLTDVTLHIDEHLGQRQLDELESGLRAHDGVVGIGRRANRPHLMIVEYDPNKVTRDVLLSEVTSRGLHGELVGL